MEKGSPKGKTLKRIIGIAVPALIMVITVIMVSVSFAWFTTGVNPTVQTIRLSVDKAFIISFTAESDSGTRNINFKGQTAIDRNGRLVTDSNGRVHSSLGGAGLQQYMLDAPYYFITTIALDTDASDVDMNMVLDTAKITSGSTVLNSYNIGSGGFAAEDIPYAFTWYFKVNDAGSVNYKGTVVGDDDRRVMDYRLPADGEVWYTPYGKLEFDANHLVRSVNDVAVNNAADAGAQGWSILDEGIKDVLLRAENTKFDFYIVFAPQKLYWAQFCNADKDKTVSDIYSEEERVKIFGTSANNQMYYSSMGYFGATFEFGATMRVTAVH